MIIIKKISKAVAVMAMAFGRTTANVTVAHAAPTCSRYCTPGVSKGCGASCIPVANNCHKDWTTACNEERPETADKTIVKDADIKHVNERPGGGR